MIKGLGLGPWRATLLVVVGLLAAYGGFTGYNRVAQVGAAELKPDQQVVTVRRGSLEAVVTATGSIEFGRVQDLGFRLSSGRTVVQEVLVEAGDLVREGQLLARLDTTDLERAVRQAELNLRVTELNLQKVANPYTEADIAEAQAAVRQAQAALEIAELDYQLTKTSRAVTEEPSIKSDLANYYQLQAGKWYQWYLEDRVSFQDYLDREKNYLDAKADYEQARQNAEKLLRQGENNIAKASDTLRQAQDKLNKILAGPDALDLELRRNDLAKAQLSLEQARQDLEGATLVSPFSGVVTAVNIAAGSQVTSTTVAIKLADLTSIQVMANVDEVDVGQVRVGQEVRVTLDALPNLRLRGRVKSVSPAGVKQQGVVSYPVTIELDSGQAELRQGLTVAAGLITARRENVLLIPNRALQGRESNRFVEVLAGGKPQERRVRTGLSSDQSTEIISGLEEGEQVLLPRTTTAPARIPGGFGLPGGFGPR